MQALSVSALSVASPQGTIVSEITFALEAGIPLTLLGESGSGKSLVAQAIMGNLPMGLSAAGHILLDGVDLLAGSAATGRARWGRTISLLPQEPWLVPARSDRHCPCRRLRPANRRRANQGVGRSVAQRCRRPLEARGRRGAAPAHHHP
ncbi:ATP-binding cassette domain-containing protein [Sinorhizobium sp. RAC02]|uniref:ATP-binding cassette domain-containing protein n=1 Tax=Sinorhizobium sp. RAC02 TaxID=1842534 RepID=UPI00336C1043